MQRRLKTNSDRKRSECGGTPEPAALRGVSNPPGSSPGTPVPGHVTRKVLQATARPWGSPRRDVCHRQERHVSPAGEG